MTPLQQLIQQAYLSDAPAQDPNQERRAPDYQMEEFRDQANQQARSLHGYNPYGEGLGRYRRSQPSLEEILQKLLKTDDPPMSPEQRAKMPGQRGEVDIGGGPSAGQWAKSIFDGYRSLTPF